MVQKSSLFMASVEFSASRFFPARRQRILEILEEVSPELPEALCCQDVLELWLKEYGPCGLLLGNLGLFLLGFLLMLSSDILLGRCRRLSSLVELADAAYCWLKFETSEKSRDLLVLMFLGIWLMNGFQWSLALIFLVLFTNVCVRRTGGDALC